MLKNRFIASLIIIAILVNICIPMTIATNEEEETLVNNSNATEDEQDELGVDEEELETNDNNIEEEEINDVVTNTLNDSNINQEEDTNSEPNEEETEVETINIEENQEDSTVKPEITYRVQGQDYGWQNWVNEGEVAGTVGQYRRMEAIRIKLTNSSEDASIEYKVQGQDYGWQNWVKDGELGGTEGQYRRMEAIRIRLVNVDDYTVEYRAQVEDYGWLPWVSDGEVAGTEGESKRMEAIQIRIIKKEEKTPSIKYRAQGQDYGWQNWVYSGQTAGTEGQSRRLEGLKINLINAPTDAHIEYQAQGQDYGWQNWVRDGKLAGTEGQSKRLEGIKIRLVNMDKYSVEYRVQVQDYGWLDWVVDGDLAGTEGLYKRVEGIQIRIVPKKAKNPSIVYKAQSEDYGWQGEQKDGVEVGHIGTRLEGLRIRLNNVPEDAHIEYQAQGQDYGWQNWVRDGEIAGTEGQYKRLEAIRIRLVNMNAYSIEYNAYVRGMGWQGWALDGEIAGTEGQSKQIEAIRIRLIPKVTETRSKIQIDSPSNGSEVYQETKVIKGWAMDNTEDSNVKLFIDGTQISINREKRLDIIDTVKGYGGYEKNPNPGFYANVDFSNYSVGQHTITAKLYSSDGALLKETSSTIYVKPKITYQEGTYGVSGLSVNGDSRGSSLKYYRIGDGPNVFFATFAVHGFEDLWSYDGQELTKIANAFKDELVSLQDVNIAEKWTIYIFPSVNPDGEYHGYTNNGPGRTSLYSAASSHKGIDINRCWSTGYTVNSTDRNYTGTAAFQAYEAQYLRDFLLSKRATNGQTVLVDLHGWLNETIGDNQIGSYYRNHYSISKHISTYGNGYLVNWARNNLGYNGRTARTALIELPPVSNSSQVDSNGFAIKYIYSALDMLRNLL